MMKRDSRNLGIEIIVILVAFIFSILILSRFFVNAKNRSLEAAHLSDAVTLASNCADVFLATKDLEELNKVLADNNGNIKGKTLTVCFDENLRPAKEGAYQAKITLSEENEFAKAQIDMFYLDGMIYSIHTGRSVTP